MTPKAFVREIRPTLLCASPKNNCCTRKMIRMVTGSSSHLELNRNIITRTFLAHDKPCSNPFHGMTHLSPKHFIFVASRQKNPALKKSSSVNTDSHGP